MAIKKGREPMKETGAPSPNEEENKVEPEEAAEEHLMNDAFGIQSRSLIRARATAPEPGEEDDDGDGGVGQTSQSSGIGEFEANNSNAL